MKILHYINDLSSGGAEKLLTDILPLMNKDGNKVYLIISHSRNNFIKNEEIIKSSGVIYKELGLSIRDPFQIFKLLSFVKENKIDLIHAHLFPSQYWLAFASFFLPKRTILVKTEHNAFNRKRRYSILKPLEKFIYSRYHTVIAITKAVKDNLSQWIGADCTKIEIINNGVNLKQINSEIEIGTDFKFNENYHNLLMIGRFDGHQKDQVSLIKALKYLPNNFRVYFVGVGEYLNYAKELSRDLNLDKQVFFLGRRSDVYALMNKVDLNVLSTNHEGLSGVTLESLASGKPFIGSNVEGIKEIVPSKDFLFPPSDPKSLAFKIKTIRENSEMSKNMVSLSLEHVKLYDTTFMVEKHLELYCNLANRQNS